MGFPRQDTGVGCHFLLQGIFPIQRSNLGLPHCRGASFPQAPSFQCRRISMRVKLVFYSNLWWDIPGYFTPSSPSVLQSEWWLWKEEFWVCSLVISISMDFPTESTYDLPFQTLPYWGSLLPSPLPVTVKFGSPVLGSSWLVNTQATFPTINSKIGILFSSCVQPASISRLLLELQEEKMISFFFFF